MTSRDRARRRATERIAPIAPIAPVPLAGVPAVTVEPAADLVAPPSPRGARLGPPLVTPLGKPLGTPLHGIPPVTTGSYAARDWLRERGLDPGARARWFVEIALDVIDAPAPRRFRAATDTRFQLHIYADEWAFLCCHGGGVSWIRVGVAPIVHARDDHGLVERTPLLREIGSLVRGLEQRWGVAFRREHALVGSSFRPSSGLATWIKTL